MNVSKCHWLIVLGLLAGCASPSSPSTPPTYTLEQAADSIPIRYGDMAVVGTMLLTFDDVPEDSRCPTTVQCGVAGDATVVGGVTSACALSTPPCSVPILTLTLHTDAMPRADTLGGREYRLVALRPIPTVPGPIPKARYVAWLRVRPVTRNASQFG
ncbi:MAG: hypothetical protein U0132_23405 [Gemmatimonadaceae bacterium]